MGGAAVRVLVLLTLAMCGLLHVLLGVLFFRSLRWLAQMMYWSVPARPDAAPAEPRARPHAEAN